MSRQAGRATNFLAVRWRRRCDGLLVDLDLDVRARLLQRIVVVRSRRASPPQGDRHGIVFGLEVSGRDEHPLRFTLGEPRAASITENTKN